MNLLLLLLCVVHFKDIRAYRVVNTSDYSICTRYGTNSTSSLSGNYPCHSFVDLLDNLTDNVTIYLTTDMELSSVMQLEHLKNIAIIGYNNPTVQCGCSGGLHFVSCHNVTIKGITWNGGCDTNQTTAVARLSLHNSSSLSFQNCVFKNLMGQIIVLSKVSGNVHINNCKFSHNYYNNHGAAIFHSPKDIAQLVLMIHNCTFDYNKGASIVYLDHSGTSSLENCTFNNNQGVSAYIVNQKLFISGLVLFEENNATDGAGLYVGNHASVIFTESAVVVFNRNVANRHGGAITVTTTCTISFEQSSVVVFNSNTALYGGAIVLYDSVITIKGKSNITFNDNSAKTGGAVFSVNECILLLVENSRVTFTDNNAEVGGAIFLFSNSSITFDDNTVVVFTNNSAMIQGGAVNSQDNAYIVSNGNSFVVFSYNHAKERGGALVINYNSDYTTKGTSTVVFHNNNADLGGAIVCDTNCNIAFKESSSLKFHDNSASNGGAVYYVNYAVIVFEGSASQTHFSNNSAQLGGALFARNYTDLILAGNSVVTFNNNNASEGGAIGFHINCNAIIKGNTSVMFINNSATNLGGAVVTNSMNITVDENCTISFTDNIAKVRGGAICDHNSAFTIKGDAIVTFSNNKADIGGGVYNEYNSTFTVGGKSSLSFCNNTATIQGGGVYTFSDVTYAFQEASEVLFLYNTAEIYGGAIYSIDHCSVIFQGNSSVTFQNNTANDIGGVAVTIEESNFAFRQNSVVIFDMNRARSSAGCIATNNSNITFGGNTTVTFTNNLAEKTKGATIHFTYNSTVTIEGNSKVNFYNNKAKYGGAVGCICNSIIIVHQNSIVIFDNNNAESGGGMHLTDCISIFRGQSVVTFKNNTALLNGGAAVYKSSNIVLMDNSSASFISNTAKGVGGAAFYINSHGVFQENSTVKFIDNTAKSNGGAICFSDNSTVSFDTNSTSIVTFHNNQATQGGAMYTEGNNNITIMGQSKIIFTNNNATSGGAIYCYNNSMITTRGSSLVTFANNTALNQGGALVIKQNSHGRFKESSNTTLNSNKAIFTGGSLLLELSSKLTFEDHCTVTFDNNIADDSTGGAISTSINSTIEFKDNSTVMFNKNSASQGGAIYSLHNSNITFGNTTVVTFSNNTAGFGGALNFNSRSFITLQGDTDCTIIFDNNTATQSGGAIYIQKTSEVTFERNVTVIFLNNNANRGGAINCIRHCNITSKENAYVTFSKNNAILGGAIYTMTSNITITDSSNLKFTYNTAIRDGGALFLDKQFIVILTGDADITFSFNNASDYGGAIYSRVDQSVINFNVTNIHFDNNHARIAGYSVFINVPTLCNSSCLHNSILGVTENVLQHNELCKHITTTPKNLVLYKPAQCIDKSDVECDHYYIKNIMLGQAIPMDLCMYDYYDRPTSTAEFLVSSTDNQGYYIPGSHHILISCNQTFQGISINGNKSIASSFNYSMTISLYVARISEMKTISLDIIVQLSSCQLGFWYDDTSHKCECYNSTSIIFCSGSNSTIKRGYWLGTVTGKPAITFCPINYCNFTCCETTNGYYHLYPVRDNQCMLHRSGIACGSCEAGYSLSFDSTECTDVKACTIGQTILLATLITLYWIAIVVAVFVMMYFKVEIGYLYGITYYYSIVDILLTQNWFLSNKHLYTVINVMSSITKITPQFLGQFCLVQGMSGIDQVFIHYTHPLAVSFILLVISCLARRSRKLSKFISRGIIPFICFLLLLSYTSVATTSLLLMRPLTFHNVDKVYTYLSPDIEYFHGRHLLYGIVAILATIVIVLGLPFILLFEPFLNRKINFVKIKPLLDQFQGCYKDKFRCFAAYYMICRLVIIVIIIVNSPNDFITHYLIITACVLMALTHQHFKPYTDIYLNSFDGDILYLTILISFLPLVEFFDSYNTNLVIGTAYVLVLLPLVGLITTKIIIHRKIVKKMKDYFRRCKQPRNYNEIPLDEDQEHLLTEDDVTMDDNMRNNANV